MPDDPDDCDNWDRCSELIPHVLNLSALLDPGKYPLEPVARIEALAGGYLNARGFRGEALALLRKAVERTAGLCEGRATVTWAEAEHTLARVERNLGDLTQAVAHARHAWELAETAADPRTKVAALNILGRVLIDSGDVTGGEHAYRIALDLVGRGPLAGTRLAVTVLNHHARALMGRHADHGAVNLLRRALDIDRVLHPHPHADTAWTLDNLAMAKLSLGDIDGAESDLREALEIESGIHGPDHPRTAWSLRNLSKVLTVRGDALSARSLLVRSLAVIDRATPNNRTEVLATATALATTCRLLDDHQGERFAQARIAQVRDK
jgi:tetratricopeptide (TPR) repeat protein